MLDIAALGANERVQHELMVRAREEKTTRNGDPYAVITVGNATGQISANVWKEQLPWIDGVKPASIVQVIGTVEVYQGKRQLKLTAPLRLVAKGAGSEEARVMQASLRYVFASEEFGGTSARRICDGDRSIRGNSR